MDFDTELKQYQNDINDYLDKTIPSDDKHIGTILSSMRYSVFAGGKRLRPVLMLGTAEIFDCPFENIMPYAAGIEMIHTYSLIHDDLPGMDDDDYRRGKPTNHRVYGTGMAILAGDGLLNFAFEHMLEHAYKNNGGKYVKAVLEIAHASGIHGMIGGQSVDIENTGKPMSMELIKYMHKNKTGALIKAAVKSSAIISGADDDDIKRLGLYGSNLGLAFQIIDDILDVCGDDKKLGKDTGSDASNNKATYVSLYGIEKSKDAAASLTEKAICALKHYGDRAQFLYKLTDYLLKRDF